MPTVVELRKEAKTQIDRLRGYSTMKKEQLCSVLGKDLAECMSRKKKTKSPSKKVSSRKRKSPSPKRKSPLPVARLGELSAADKHAIASLAKKSLAIYDSFITARNFPVRLIKKYGLKKPESDEDESYDEQLERIAPKKHKQIVEAEWKKADKRSEIVASVFRKYGDKGYQYFLELTINKK